MHIEQDPRPDVPVVSMPEAKLHLRADGDHDDINIARLIDAATDAFEDAAGVALITRQIRVTLTSWPAQPLLPLPVAPLIDAQSVTMTADGQPVDDFGVVSVLRPAVFLRTPAPGPIQIVYTAGFGATAGAVPADIRAAIIDQLIPLDYERGLDSGKGTGVSAHMARVIAKYRRVAI